MVSMFTLLSSVNVRVISLHLYNKPRLLLDLPNVLIAPDIRCSWKNSQFDSRKWRINAVQTWIRCSLKIKSVSKFLNLDSKRFLLAYRWRKLPSTSEQLDTLRSLNCMQMYESTCVCTYLQQLSAGKDRSCYERTCNNRRIIALLLRMCVYELTNPSLSPFRGG